MNTFPCEYLNVFHKDVVQFKLTKGSLNEAREVGVSYRRKWQWYTFNLYNYRHVILMNSHYKILVNRLHDPLEQIVEKEQTYNMRKVNVYIDPLPSVTN